MGHMLGGPPVTRMPEAADVGGLGGWWGAGEKQRLLKAAHGAVAAPTLLL